MTTQPDEILELTPEQHRKLGQVYQMILSWRHLPVPVQQRDTEQQSTVVPLISPNTVTESEA